MHKLLLLLIVLYLHCSIKPSLYEQWDVHIIDDEPSGADGVKLGDVNNDGLVDIVTGWEESGITRLYINPGTVNVKKMWPTVDIGETPSVEDAVFVDLNQNGWLDVVTCCEGDERRMYVHWNPGREYLQQSVSWVQQLIPQSDQRMQWMFCVPADVDGKHGIDLVAAGKNDNAEIGWFEAPEHPQNLDAWIWHPISEVGWVMSILMSDVDGDNDLDVLISDRKGEHRSCRWLENPGPDNVTGYWQSHIIGGKEREVMFMTHVDFDGDGLMDVLTAAKPRSILYFRRLDNRIDWKEYECAFPPQTGTAKAVRAADVNLDGGAELVVTCEGAEPPKSGVFLLEGENTFFKNPEFVNISGPKGIKFDRIELLDIDGDGDSDVLTCEERHNNKGLGLIWYENPNPDKQSRQ